MFNVNLIAQQVINNWQLIAVSMGVLSLVRWMWHDHKRHQHLRRQEWVSRELVRLEEEKNFTWWN